MFWLVDFLNTLVLFHFQILDIIVHQAKYFVPRELSKNQQLNHLKSSSPALAIAWYYKIQITCSSSMQL